MMNNAFLPIYQYLLREMEPSWYFQVVECYAIRSSVVIILIHLKFFKKGEESQQAFESKKMVEREREVAKKKLVNNQD